MKIYLRYLLCATTILISQFVYGAVATLVTDPPNSHYCQGTTGLKFKIDNSVNGITYRLRKPLSGPGDLATVVGNGGTVTFPGDYQSGTYITVPTTNQITVWMDPQPSSFVVSTLPTNGKFCNYPDASGVVIMIAGSQPGAEYEVFLGAVSQGTAWPGDGYSHSFGYFTTPGIYTVKAKIISTGCLKNMGNVTIILNTPPVASFTYLITNPCSSTPVTFTSTTPGAGLTYLWKFDDVNSVPRNVSTLQNPSHVFEAWGNGSETFHVNFRVTDANGCKDTIIQPVTVTQKPDVTLTDVLNATNPNYPNTFAYCGANNVNPLGYFEFHNATTTSASNTLYNITWGNCTTTPTFNSATFTANIPVTYTCLGEQAINYSVNGQNGCNNSRQYGVFVGSNPGGGLTTPPNTYGIAPFLVNFIIPEQAYSSTPGTEYVYNFGDGITDTIYQEDLPADHILPHIYTTCSDSMIDGLYAYKAICTVKNPCGKIITTVFPIHVSCMAQGNFGGGWEGGNGWWTGDTIPDHIVGCNPVPFSNLTHPGFYIFPNGSAYTSNTFYNWNFGDPASGTNNTSILANPIHTFTNSGQIYTITLITYTGQNLTNNSGFDTIVKYLYVQTNPTANFVFDTTEACVPKYVQIHDTSEVGGMGIPKYLWTITPPVGWQIVTPFHEGDNTYSEPLIKFTAMGQPPDYLYNIKLRLVNSCDTSFTELPVLVCEPPLVAFPQNEVYYCGPGPRLFNPAYNLNCDSSTISILWEVTPSAGVTFEQGTTDSSYNPVINFPDFGDYLVKVTINNGCGSDNKTMTVHITQLLSNNVISLSPAQFCGCISQITITGAMPQGGSGTYTFQWDKNQGTGWEPIAVGGTGQNYQINSPLCESTLYRRTAYDAGDCSDFSTSLEITIHPAVQNNLILGDQSVCGAAQPALITGTAPFGGSSPFTFSWEQSTDGGSIWTIIAGAISLTYQPIIINFCEPISNNQIPVSSTEICAGKAPAPLMGTDPVGACGLYIFQWQKSTVSPYTTFINIPGADGPTYQPAPLIVKTHFRRIVSSSASCHADTSNVVIIDVNPNPVAEAGLYAPIPNGWTITLTGSATGGTLPYTNHQWSPSDKINGDPFQQTVTSVALTTTTTFNYKVTDSNGCEGSDNTVISITGNPLVCSIAANPNSICPDCLNGQAHICATASGGSGNYTYSWTSTPPGFTSSLQCIDVCPTTSTNYVCVIWDGFASCTSNTTIAVDPVPVITSALTVSLCSGDAVNYSPVSSVSGSTYTWTTSAGSCIGNNSGQGITIGDILFNYGSVPCQVTYDITPHGPAPNFCAGNSVTLVVNVMPVAQISNSVNFQVLVSGQMTVPVTFTSNVDGVNFRWEFFDVTCPGFISPYLMNGTAALLPAQLLSISTGGPATCTLKYKVTPWIALPGGVECLGTPFYYSIIINTEPEKYNLICPPPVCAGTPVAITLDGSDFGIDYQLLKSSVPVPGGMQSGTGDTLEWTIPESGVYTILGTNITNQQSILMNGQCVVTINPNPVPNYVIGSTGNCPGDIITLNGSQIGVLYELFNGNVNTGISRTGPGPLDFGIQINPGTYKIKATYPLTGCWVWIDDEAIILPLPLQFLFSPAGSLCAGDEFSLENSQPGIWYSLVCTPATGSQFTQGPWLGGTGAINFGHQFTPGVYKVLAYNPITGCDVYMDDEKAIWQNPVPYNITPSGAHCGLTEIGLDNSETGYTYRVHKIDPSTGTPYILPDPNFSTRTGINGQPLVFGSTSVPWTYVVITYDANNICHSQMNDSVIVLSSPSKYQMLPTGIVCFDPGVGKEILLEHSDIGIEYTLFLSGAPWSLPKPGIGGADPLSFGFITVPGPYTISARNVANNCTETMTGSLLLQLDPVRFTLNPQIESCAGVDIWLSGSEENVTYKLHPPAGTVISLPGDGNPLHWGIKYQPGNYYVTAHSAITSCNDTMTGIVTINQRPGVYGVKPQGINCELQDIGMENAEANTTYEIVHQDGSQLPVPVETTTVAAGSFWFNQPQPAGIYKVKATTSKGCDTLMSGQVVIDPRPTVDAGAADITVCNLPPNTVDLTGTATGFSSVKWSSPTNPSGSNFSDQYSLATTYTFTAADLSNKQVILTLRAFGANGCANAEAQDQITINILAPLVDAGPNQSVCDNETVILSGTITGGTITGVWSGGTGTFTPNRQALNAIYDPDPSEAGSTITLTLTSTNADPCPDLNDQMTIFTFNPMIAGAASPDQSVCNGQISQPISATLPAGGSGMFAYQWQELIGVNWTDIYGATNLSYSPPQLTTTSHYRLRQADNFCNPDQIVTTNEILITVFSPFVSGTVGNNQTICYNQTPDPLIATVPAGGSSNYTYQWQAKTGTGNWTNIQGATNLAYSPSALTTTTSYQLIQTDIWCNPAQDVISNLVTITVHQPLVSGSAANDQFVCFGTIPSQLSVTPPSGGSGTFSYQWQLKANSGSWVDIPSAIGQTYSPPALSETTQYRVIHTDIYCDPYQQATSNVVTVTVYNQLMSGAADTDQTLCYGEIPNPLHISLPVGGSGNFTYQWQNEIAGAGWNDIPGATNLIYSPPSLTTTIQYRVIQTDAWCAPHQEAISNVVTITVYNQLVVGSAGNNQTICNGETPAALVVSAPSGGSGLFTFQWQAQTGIGGWNNISGATDLIFSPIALTATTNYRIIQTDSWCNPDRDVTSNIVTITVYDLLVTGTAGMDQIICFGETPVPIASAIPAGGSGNFAYQWQSQVGNGGWYNIPSANGLTLAPSALTQTTQYRLIQTDDYCNPDQEEVSNIVTITVSGQLFAGVTSADQSICYGETPVPLSATIPAGGSGNFTYQWQEQVGAGAWNNIANAYSLLYAPTPLTATTRFRVVQSDNRCNPLQTVTSNIVTITVFGQLGSGTASSDQTICMGETPVAVAISIPSGGSGAFSYHWQLQVGGGAWNNIPGATNSQFAPPALTQSTKYRVIQKDNQCVPSPEIISNEVTVTVHELMVSGTVTVNQTICYAEAPDPLNISVPSGGSGNFTYQWQIQAVDGSWNDIPGANDLLYNPQALTATTHYRVVQSDIDCDPVHQINSNVVTISVYDQLFAGNVGVDQTICYGETPNPLIAVLPGGGSGNFVYNWQVKDGFGGWNNIFGATTLIWAPPSLFATTQYRIVQTDNHCSPEQLVNSVTVTITVYDEFVAGVAGVDQIICMLETPEPVTATLPAGGSGNRVFRWQSKTLTSAWTDIPNATTLSYSPPALSETTIFRLKQSDTWCNPDQEKITNEVTITATPVPVPTISGAPLVCINSTGNVYQTEPDNLNYTWNVTGGTITAGGGTNDNTVTIKWTTLGQGTVSVNYHENSHNCPAASPTVIHVNVVSPPVPVIATIPAGTSVGCIDECITFETEPGMTNYQWLTSTGGQICSLGQSTDRRVVVKWTSAGFHWVSVNYTGLAGCAATTSTVFPVTIIPAPTPTITGPNFVCEGSLTATYLTEPGMTGYQWTIPAGGTIAGGQGTNHLTVIWNTIGNHTVTVTYTNYFGCEAVTPTIYQVSVTPLPVPLIVGNLSVCIGSANNIYSTAPGNSGYVWTTSAGGVITGGGGVNDYTVTIQWNSSGFQSVSVSYTDVNGCEATFPTTINVFVNPSPAPAIAGPDTVCRSENSMVYSTQPGMSGYIWTVSAGGQIVNGTGTNTIGVNWFATGNQTVSVNYSNASGCNSTNPTLFNVSVNDRPFTDFIANNVCKGSPTTFTNQSTTAFGTITTYLWEFGDGQTSQAEDPVHLYLNAGLYNVKLTVTNTAGCVKDTTKQANVWGKPNALFSYGVSNCAGDSVQFTDLSTTVHGYINQWTWDFGDGSAPVVIPLQGNPNVKHRFLNSGTFNVKLTITTSDDCISQKINPVSVAPRPLANFAFSTASCALLPVQFTDLSQLNGGLPITSWIWNFGEPISGIANTSPLQNPVHVYQSGGIYSVKLIVTNANGCLDSIRKSVTINATPVAKFAVDSSCIQSPTQFTDSSTTVAGTIVAWAWNFGDPASGANNISTLENPTHIFNTPGNYWVSLHVTNSNQCGKDTAIMVTANPKPIADFQHSVPCMQDTTQFTDLSIAPNSSIKSWRWNFGDNGTDSIQNPKHAYLTAGTFNVTLIVTNLYNCSDTVTKPMVVRYKPLSAFNWQSYFCPANEVNFQDSSQAYGGAFISSRIWIFEPGSTFNGINPQHHFGSNDTTYSVTLMVTDNFGCKDTTFENVYVKPGYDLTFDYDTACLGAATHFRAINRAAGDTLYSLRWDFGDPDSGPNNFSTMYEPEHEFSQTGTFVVSLKAWNSNNCVDSLFRIVQVRKLAEPDFTFQTLTCIDTVRFVDKSKPGFGTIAKWKWIWGDGTPSITIMPPAKGDTMHVYANPGDYPVKLIATNSHGCTDSIVKEVSVACIAAAFTQLNSFNCSSDSISFLDGSSPVNRISSWHWNFGDTKTLDYTAYRDTVCHKFAPGTYQVTLTIKTSSGGAIISADHQLSIIVHAAPVANFTTNTVCYGDSTRFTDLAQENQVPITYREWKFGDGSSVAFSDIIVNPVHKYLHGGVYNNKFIVKNNIGCRDSIIKPVIVHKLPVASFTNSTACQRYDIKFADGSGMGDTTMMKWWWNFNNPENPYDTLRTRLVTKRFDSAGIYPVYFKVMDKNGCIDDTINIGFDVEQSPVAAFTITENFDGKPGKIRLNNESSGAKEKAYKWDYQTGTSVEMNPVVTYTDDNTVYIIELVTWNYENCYDTTSLSYEFHYDNLFVPNAFSPTSLALDVREFKPKGVNLSAYHVTVFDKWGHLLWENTELDTSGRPVSGWDGAFNGELMPQDVYIWKISATFKNGKVWEGSESGTGSVSNMGTVTLIR
ncbi:MAG: PKD domain-containing protein [Bacteroidetes bacterium]|nr:PKD domain-containing protein [Bacteroidota bacterium]